MNISKNDLEAILHDAEKRRDEIRGELPRLEETIAAAQVLLRNIYHVEMTTTTLPGVNNGQQGPQLTVTKLAEIILNESGQALSSQELADRMMAMGKVFRSNNPRPIVYTVLKRRPSKFQYRKGRWSLRHEREGGTD